MARVRARTPGVSPRRRPTGVLRGGVCLVVGALGIGCGAQPHRAAAVESLAASSPTAGGEVARVVELEAQESERLRRIRELESRLALRDAEVRDLRDQSERLRETVRLGETRRAEESVETEPAGPEEEDQPRIVLRLSGPPPEAALLPATDSHSVPVLLAPPPSGALGRLPVLPGSQAVPAIPPQPLAVASSPAVTYSTAPTAPDATVRAYQRALTLVASRDHVAALSALTGFLEANPTHPYADNALYWRAEVHYARRDFVQAERDLLALLERFPGGNKTADALLRLGFCRDRQGDPVGARRYFRRVMSEFPTSAAARLASREDT